MTFIKQFFHLGILLIAMVFSSTANAGYLIYDWAGVNGTGSITFFDTNIADEKNFTVAFDTKNVANISYTFKNGVSIEDADNFSGNSTLQALNELGGAMFTATDGIIKDWNFNYTAVQSILPLDIYFENSSTTGIILCITTPCPVDTANISFIGNSAKESNAGDWHLQTVPIPTAVWFFLSGVVGLFGFGRPASKTIEVNS